MMSSRQRMDELQQQAGRAEAELVKVQGELRSLRHSSSWRLTAPVRATARSLRLLRSASRVDLISLPRFIASPKALKQWVRSLKAIKLVRTSDLFDAPWYLKTYPDAAASGLDPARHYVTIGADLGYQPSARFDSRWYLEQYPDVARARVNPLQHYILHGKKSGRHPRPSQSQVSRKKVQARSGNTAGLGRIEQSNAGRLNQVDQFKRQIADYQETRRRRPDRGLRVAVYSAAIGDDALVLQPARINPDFDYWCFTDREQVDVGIWQFAPLPFSAANEERALRYIKTHPHQLLSAYDVAIWVEPGMQLHGMLQQTLEVFLASEKPFGALANQSWSTLYEEADYCMNQYPGEAAPIREQVAALEAAGYVHDDLIDPAWFFIDLRQMSAQRLLTAWWCLIDRYSYCDQLSLNPALDQTGVPWHRLAEVDLGVSDHYSLAIAQPALERPTTRALEAEFNPAAVDPSCGDSFALHRDQALAGVNDKQIDVVFYASHEHRQPARSLEAVIGTLLPAGVRLLVVNHDCLPAAARMMQAVCEQYAWAELIECPPDCSRTAALNRGLEASGGDLVLLLDAQVSVAADWARKLAHVVFSTPGAGLVGPVTNAAATQSVIDVSPAHRYTGINVLPPGMGVTDLDQHCEQIAVYGAVSRVPVVGGFCLGVTRAALTAIGGFDEQLFPDAIGHDFDFSLRATDAGFGIVIADNTFVFQHLAAAGAAQLSDLPGIKATRALAGIHGDARVARVSQAAARDSRTRRLRQSIKVLDRRLRAALPTVSVLPGISGRGMPGSSAYIRLVLPLALPDVTSRADIDLLGYWDRKLPVPGSAKIAYLQRDIVDVSIDHIQAWSRAWKDAGGKVYFDLDDDLFDTEGLMARTRATVEKAQMTQARIRAILDCTDVVTVSTPELAQRLDGLCTQIVIMPNDLDSRLWGLPDLSRCETPCHADGVIRIGYIGTATHQQDLEIIAPAVQRVAKQLGERVQIEVVGAFEGRDVLFGRSLDLQGASEYPAFVDWAVNHVNWDIGLIPLVDDTFNRSKSDLKFTEYAALGMAIICSDVPSYQSLAVHEHNSLVVPNEEQAWYEAIVRLVEDAMLRKRLALTAHQYVCDNRSLQGNQTRVVELLAQGL